MLNEKYQTLLNQYDICADHLKRNRGGLLCFTNHGIYSLSQTSLSEERLQAVSQWTTLLNSAHFSHTDQYIPNKNDCFLSYDKYYETFALRRTFAGSECDVHSLKDMRIAASNLGKLHRISKNLTFPSRNLRKYTSVKTVYRQKNSEMKSILKYILGKKNKGTFEYLFLAHQKDFCAEMSASLEFLDRFEPSFRGWCHGCYNHHNVLLTDSGPATIRFEHFFYGYPLLDLYYFLKKVLEKNDYRFSFCECILKNYCSQQPLTTDDFGCLYGLFLFPEKFCKISNQYMGHKKHWVSPRYIDKLEEFILSKELRAVFLEKYMQNYNVI